jgi:ribonucleoside-diphosphate reductase alpha chain
VIRPEDTLETLKEKIGYATILGTLQSTLTKFRYLRKIWTKNCEEERLLGVSLTGIMDNPLTANPGPELEFLLSELREHAIATNKEWAGILGVSESTSITTVKPSGTVSQLVDSSSGIHPRYSHFYVRTVRSDIKDPLGKMLLEQGVPAEPDETKPNDVMVFSFPQKSPDHSVFRNDRTAIEQLNLYLAYKTFWCEHNPSITVYVKESEWMEVGAWVYKHFDLLGGVSFLPADEGKTIYKQAPYQEITEEEYNNLLPNMPEVKWDDLKLYEIDDQTTSAKELACSSGSCELL